MALYNCIAKPSTSTYILVERHPVMTPLYKGSLTIQFIVFFQIEYKLKSHIPNNDVGIL